MTMERDPNLAPPTIIDLENQDNVFLVLEELGIAHMQSMWIRRHAPEHEDAQAVHEQAAEFLEDLIGIFLGQAGADRVKPNTWAGARLASHLAMALGLNAANDEAAIREALDRYLDDLNLLTAYEASEKAAGRTLPAKDYIDFMAGWSALFSGKANRLLLPMAFLVHKASEEA